MVSNACSEDDFLSMGVGAAMLSNVLGRKIVKEVSAPI